MNPKQISSFKEFLMTPSATLRSTHCIQCKQLFSESNTHTPAGWKETQISGICEDCFDSLFQDEEE